MHQPTLAEIIQAWQTRKQDRTADLLASSIQTIKLLASGQPVSKEQFQSQTSLADDEVTAYFERLKRSGCEFDAQGRLVGNALSLTPSPYRLQVNGQQLYAWCALDTLFLSACIRQPAQVTSVAAAPPPGAKRITR